MDRRIFRSVWSLPASLGLALTIALVGGWWVFAQSSQSSPEAGHGSAAYGVQPQNLSRVSNDSSIIVEGVVTEVYPAEWTTPDKNPPLSLAAALTNQNIQVRTPVLLEISQVYKGEGVPGTILFTLPGGRAGNITVSSPFGMTLLKGDRIVAFLSTAPKNAGPWAEISPLYPQLLFLVDGKALHGPDTTISRSSLEAQLGLVEG